MRQVCMANDGKVFYTEEECFAYESRRILGDHFDSIKDSLSKIETICTNRRSFAKKSGTYCSDGCPFSTKNDPRTMTSDCLFATTPDTWRIDDFFYDIVCFEVPSDTSTLEHDDLQDQTIQIILDHTLCDFCKDCNHCKESGHCHFASV